VKKFFLYLVFLSLTTGLAAQNEARKWYFGNQAGLDFNTNPPTVLANSSMSVYEGCSSMSDAGGNLLFYTDGMNIWTSTHTLMANGTGLNGGSTPSQGSLIIRRPGSTTLYYVFTVVGVGGSAYYSVVDMSLAAGHGSVVTKNSVLYSGSCAEKLTGTKHCNGSDYWVVIRDWTNNGTTNFRSYLLSATGVSTVAVVSPATTFTTSSSWWYDIGCMKISPNGKKLGLALYNYWWNSNNWHSFEIWDYNNSTGAVTNSLGLLSVSQNTWNYGYGCEFSPDGTKFYGSRLYSGWNNQGGVFQWNLCAGSPSAVAASQTVIATSQTVNTHWYASMQLAPNGKIYIARWYGSNASNSISVIHNPNAAGTACNFVDLGQSLSPNHSWYGLPNFVGSWFVQPPPVAPFTYTVSNSFGCQGAAFTTPVTPNTTISVCSVSGYSLLNLQWNFGDPNSGAANTSTVANPVHAFTSLGTYTVKLVLNYSCGGGSDTLTQLVNINQPCISVASTSITCASLGSATVQATGGIGPFSYTWMPTNQTSSVATGLSPGTYTLTVFDFGNNFTYTATTQFTSLIPLTGNVSHAGSVTCHGAATATGNVTNLGGGSGSENYLWTNGTTSLTTQFVNAMSAGLWSLTVTDALTGCQINDLFLITQPFAQGLIITANTSTACVGSSISFTGQASGGTPGYTYSWSPGPASDSHTVGEATGGTYVYSLTATDANTCPITQTIAVDFISNPVLSVINASICPLQTGTLLASGATNYTWSTAANTSSISDNPLVTTAYTVTGEALGCISTATGAIFLKAVPVPLIGSNSPICNGQGLALFAGGGTGFYWTGPQSFTSMAQNPVLNVATPLHSGVYNVTVTAVNSCTAATSSTITVNPTPTISASASTVCVNGSLNLYSSSFPGSAYVWMGPANYVSNQQNPSIINPATSATGNYTVVAFSAVGCTNTAVAHASVVPLPVVSFTSNSPRCFGEDLVLNAGATTGGQVFSWSGPGGFVSGSVTNTIVSANLGAGGIYQLVVTTGPCIASYSQAVTIYPLPNPSVSYNGPVCETKSMTVLVSTPPSETIVGYTWQAPAGLGSLTNSIVVLTTDFSHSGVYSATVTDIHGCKASAGSNIIVLQNPTVTASGATVCLYQPATLTAQGAKDYFWIGPGLTVANFAKAIVGNAGSVADVGYLVIGTAANGCTSVASANLSTWSLPTPSVTVTRNRICLNGTTTLNGFGGKYYEWHGPQQIYHMGQSFSVVASSLIYSGIYTLVATDHNGCQGKATTSITVMDLPEGGLKGTIMDGCVPFCSDFSFQPAQGQPTLITTWQIFENGKAKMNFSATDKFSWCFTSAADYLIKGSYQDAATGCKNAGTFTVNVHPLPGADFYVTPEKPIENSGDVYFTDRSSGKGNEKWEWYILDEKQNKRSGEAVSYLFVNAGTYPVAMIVTNTWGCSDTVVKTVEIAADYNFFIPNSFTPNGDETNDVYLPVTRGVASYQFAIFDRWGAKLFETTDIGKGWDGRFRGNECPVGVYVYVVRLTTIHGQQKEYKGHVTLYH
jgi:gliding motility-associated-like protein